MNLDTYTDVMEMLIEYEDILDRDMEKIMRLLEQLLEEEELVIIEWKKQEHTNGLCAIGMMMNQKLSGLKQNQMRYFTL